MNQDGSMNGQKEKLFSAYGRVGRLSYFLRMLGIYLATMVIAFAVVFVFLSTVRHAVSGQWAPLVGGGIGLVGSVVIIIQAIKRFHDLNRPGIHFLLLLIPIYGLYISLLLLFKKGTEGPNEFGADPLSS